MGVAAQVATAQQGISATNKPRLLYHSNICMAAFAKDTFVESLLRWSPGGLDTESL